MRARSRTSALVLLLLGAQGCRCGGRRSVPASEEHLADVDETSPEMAARVRTAGAAADPLIAARRADLDRFAQDAAKGRSGLGGLGEERSGDRLAAVLATVAGADVALVRDGIIHGLSTYKAYGWANVLAVDEAAPVADAPPEPWADVRTYDLHWETGYIGRYAVAVRHIPVAGATPLLIGIAIRE